MPNRHLVGKQLKAGNMKSQPITLYHLGSIWGLLTFDGNSCELGLEDPSPVVSTSPDSDQAHSHRPHQWPKGSTSRQT